VAKIDIKKAEKELLELQEAFKLIDARISESGGPKSHAWAFYLRHKIYKLEEKIEDLKAGKNRTDEITPEDLKIEKRVEDLSSSLNISEGGK
jgi:hypothetical protein